MDTTNRSRPALPPIHFFQSDKFHREESDYPSRHMDVNSNNMASTTATSPIHSHPVGPPPPYSNLPPASHANAQPQSDQRTSNVEEKESIKQQIKQSLPSLQEALGVEQPNSHPSEPTFSSTHPPPVFPSPSVSSRHSFGMEPPSNPANPYPHQLPRPSYTFSHHQMAPLPNPERTEKRAIDHADYPTYQRPPPPAVGPIHSPMMSSAQRMSGHSFPSIDQSSYHEGASSNSATQGSKTFSYGYAPYPPQFAHPTSTGASSSIYQPSVTQPPPSQQSSSWRPEGISSGSKGNGRNEITSNASYGESVKRHLDMYDFEQGLNEITENSTVMLDFGRQYGARLHQTQRTGPPPGTLPAITEVDDLINRSTKTMDALNKLRDVLVAQQAVYYQQAQEQRLKTENEIKRNDSVYQAEDSKSGVFVGSDAKKRRGRAAAPGRCHSCNRAETPEWRRGPDGARTLCNACGLHYAKLTRKAGANKAAPGSSHLRPSSRERDLADD